MSDVKQFPESQFPTIHCTKLVVHPTTTDLKWSSSKRHQKIQILGSTDTAKSLSASGYRGILSDTGYLIGSDTASWYFIVNEEVDMYFGVAHITQNMNSVDGVAVKQLLSVKQNDRVKICITVESTMVIRHENRTGILIKSYILDVVPFNTQTLYPWVSTIPSETMSVKIMKDVKFITDVRTDGMVQMTGSNNNIVDFNLENIYNNNGAPIGSVGATDTIINTTSGSFVKVKDGGGVDINGGIEYKCENITSSAPTYNLSENQNIVMITNPSITSVQLPEINSTKTYTIIRNYNIQPNEMWQNPTLKVIPHAGNTIELESWIGLPPDTNIELLGDSINNWRIL